MARIEAAKTQLHDDVISVCNQIVNEKTSEALDKLSEKFRLMTLDNKDVVKKEITEYPTTIDLAHLLADRKPSCSQEVSAEDISAIMRAAYKEISASLIQSYADSVSSAKQDILDTFDSKIAELQEQKRLEEEKRKAEEEAKKAADEKARKEAEERAKAAEEERKKREAELKAAEEQAEKERLAKLEDFPFMAAALAVWLLMVPNLCRA